MTITPFKVVARKHLNNTHNIVRNFDPRYQTVLYYNEGNVLDPVGLISNGTKYREISKYAIMEILTIEL